MSQRRNRWIWGAVILALPLPTFRALTIIWPIDPFLAVWVVGACVIAGLSIANYWSRPDLWSQP